MKKSKHAMILLSVAGVITTLSFVIANTLQSRSDKNQALLTNQELLAATRESATPAPTLQPLPAPTRTPPATPTMTPEETPSSSPSQKPVSQSMILPVAGAEVVGEYTEDMLVFHETYGDYRAHIGIDFGSEKNAPVSAVLDGIITKNYFDYEDGYTIEIDHDNNLKSIYKNLSSDKMAQVGQVVKQGDVIGGIGNTGISESHLAYHLHFELSDNGIPVNPREYFNLSFEKEIARE